MTDKIRVNDREFSWYSCEFKIANAPFEGISKVAYGATRTPTKVYGMARSAKAIARTSGKYEVKPVKITWLKSSLARLKTILTPIGLGSVGTASVPGSLTCSELGLAPLVVLFEGMRLADEDNSHEENADPLMTDTEFDVMSVSENGLVLYDRGLI